MALGVEYGAKYTLTGPDGTIAVFNDSTSPNFVGILSPESSGLDSPDVREDAQERTEEDGGIHGNFYYGRRPVVLQGTIIASSATQRAERIEKLTRATNALRGDATLKWKPTGASSEVELKLRRQQPLRITKGFVKDFQAAMVSANAEIMSTTLKTLNSGASVEKFPSEVVNAAGEGSIAWTNPGNAKTSNDVRASAALTPSTISNHLKATSYGFTFPASARIMVMTAVIEAKAETETATLRAVKSVKAGVISGVESKPGTALFVAGGDTQLGAEVPVNGAITKTEAENAGFGVAIVFEDKSGSKASTVLVDALSLFIEYTVPIEPENAGDAESDFVAVLTGLKGGETAGDVELINETTGQKLVIEESLFPKGETITIDSKNKTIIHSTLGNIYSKLDFANSDWFKLPPGKTKISCPSAKLELKYRDTWI